MIIKIKIFFCGFKNGFKEFFKLTSALVNAILLFAIYFIGIFLTCIFAKIMKKNLFDIDIKPDSPTYWRNLSLSQNLNDYYRQF